MKWDTDADKAIQKVPFFVRKRVRSRWRKPPGRREKPGDHGGCRHHA
ncbi:MAG: hypothetical protein R2861_12520 [Desulfobacterales bacterium]